VISSHNRAIDFEPDRRWLRIVDSGISLVPATQWAGHFGEMMDVVWVDIWDNFLSA
jgi:hypothetical protein